MQLPIMNIIMSFLLTMCACWTFLFFLHFHKFLTFLLSFRFTFSELGWLLILKTILRTLSAGFKMSSLDTYFIQISGIKHQKSMERINMKFTKTISGESNGIPKANDFFLNFFSKTLHTLSLSLSCIFPFHKLFLSII